MHRQRFLQTGLVSLVTNSSLINCFTVSPLSLLCNKEHNSPIVSRNMSTSSSSQENNELSRPDLIRKLLKGIETGDPESATVVNEAKYIQHNPQTREGSEGLAALFARISKSNPKVNVVRAMQDGDYVFGHTEYDFSTRRIGFEVFRFDDETNQAVEHWDNIQPRMGPNPSGRSMVDGPTEPCDMEHTETNRAFVRQFVENVLMEKQQDLDKMKEFVSTDLIQHDPRLMDGLPAWHDFVRNQLEYEILHRVLACGNFVLTVVEGKYEHAHSAIYDLYWVVVVVVESSSEGKQQQQQQIIVEHWNTIEEVPPKSEWKNSNGKF